jgi:hypothetical protein
MLHIHAVTRNLGRLLVLALPAALVLASCAPLGGSAEVEGNWTGPLRLANGGGYDVELDLTQDGEELSGSGHMVAAVPGEDDAPVEVIEGSRVEGEEITLVVRDTVYGILTVRLDGTAEDEVIRAEGTYRGGGFDVAADTELTRQ